MKNGHRGAIYSKVPVQLPYGKGRLQQGDPPVLLLPGVSVWLPIGDSDEMQPGWEVLANPWGITAMIPAKKGCLDCSPTLHTSLLWGWVFVSSGVTGTCCDEFAFVSSVVEAAGWISWDSSSPRVPFDHPGLCSAGAQRRYVLVYKIVGFKAVWVQDTMEGCTGPQSMATLTRSP